MANFNLVIGSEFKPFSYEEMLAPVLMATQAQQQIEDTYDQLQSKANIWDEMADEQTDPISYNRYKQYARDLETAARDLADNGLNPNSRKRMLGLKARYSKDIAPIEQAYARRKELQDEQRKALLSNPTLMFQRNLNNIGYDSSLDRFVENPNYNYGESYSGALLTQQVSQAVSVIKNLINEKNIGKLESIGLPYQYRAKIRSGASPEEVTRAMSQNILEGDNETVSFLRGVVDNVLGSSGMANWADTFTMAKARDFANQGLYSAIGKDELKDYTDTYNMNRALTSAKSGSGSSSDNDFAGFSIPNINPSTFTGTWTEEAKKAQADRYGRYAELKNRVQQGINLGYWDANGNLTDKGRELVKRMNGTTIVTDNNGKSMYYSDKITRYIKTPRRTTNSLDDRLYHTLIELRNLASDNEADNKVLENRIPRYMENFKEWEKSTQRIQGDIFNGKPSIDIYRQNIREETDKNYVRDKIMRVITPAGGIYKIESITSDGRSATVNRGKKISGSKFKSIVEDNPILSVANEPISNTLLVELTNGDVYELPWDVLDNVSRDNMQIANEMVRDSESMQERAKHLYEANSHLGTILNWNKGTGISTNDGMMEVPKN